MTLTLFRYPKLNKLNAPSKMASTSLLNGEQYLIQTIDKKLALTTHRLIQRRIPGTRFGNKSVMLEDIIHWEVKSTGKHIYYGLSFAMAFMVYFNTSFMLLSGFFLMLYFMTRHRRIHIRTENTVMVLPLEVAESSAGSLIEMVRTAQQNRRSQLSKTETAFAA